MRVSHVPSASAPLSLERTAKEMDIAREGMAGMPDVRLITVAKKAAAKENAFLVNAVIVEADCRGRDDIAHVVRKLWASGAPEGA